jgi:hypothetical protein
MVLNMFLKVSYIFNKNCVYQFSLYLGANFPTTPAAMNYFKKNKVILGPAIAANAGLLSY